MEKTNLTKKRILSVLDIFQRYSDELHFISIEFILSLLHEQGIQATRYALYDDIKILNEAGYEINFERKKGYYLLSKFELSEMKVLMDSLQAANFLSVKNTDNITNKLKTYQSVHQQEILEASMILNPLKSSYNYFLYSMDDLLHAIHQNRLISFVYFDMDITLKKKYRKNKKRYQLLPYALLWHNQSYYCIGYDLKYKNLSHYRLDKMEEIVLGEVHDKPYFELTHYTNRFIDMYISEKTNVTLRCKRRLASILLEKFKDGLLITYVDDDIFEVNLNVDPSITFITWLFTFKKEIEVLKPQSLIHDIQNVLNDLHALYFKD